jgi:hypothetical protein
VKNERRGEKQKDPPQEVHRISWMKDLPGERCKRAEKHNAQSSAETAKNLIVYSLYLYVSVVIVYVLIREHHPAFIAIFPRYCDPFLFAIIRSLDERAVERAMTVRTLF